LAEGKRRDLWERLVIKWMLSTESTETKTSWFARTLVIKWLIATETTAMKTSWFARKTNNHMIVSTDSTAMKTSWFARNTSNQVIVTYRVHSVESHSAHSLTTSAPSWPSCSEPERRVPNQTCRCLARHPPTPCLSVRPDNTNETHRL